MLSEDAKTKWHYRDKDPPDDHVYFENMSRIVLKGSLNWQFIEDRWLAFREAFYNFNIDLVSDFDEEDIEMLMTNTKIIRSRERIEATMYNAMMFQKIIEEFDSFENYLDNLDKSKNYRYAKEELASKFEKINEKTAAIFLYSIGENIL